MRPLVLLSFVAGVCASPALAQEVDHSAHDAMPAVSDAAGAPPLADHETPAPPPATDHAADAIYDPGAMAAAREQLLKENGGMAYSLVMANLAEFQSRRGEDGYRWVGEARYGGDINRFAFKTEGEGGVSSGAEKGEVQALYSHAIGPYTDLQIGLRQDFEPHPSRTYLAVGAETLLPYWIEAEGSLYLSTKGNLLGRLEGMYDLTLTQRLILQPRIELNLASGDDRAVGIGSGLSDAELGLRLRCEIRREFAPYIGVSYDRHFGATADFARADGREVETTSFVAGVRAWF